jgi:hypothetical protein
MKTLSDFWINVHYLASSLRTEGATADDRLRNVTDSLTGLAPVAQQEVLADLNFVVAELAAVAGAIKAQHPRSSPIRSGTRLSRPESAVARRSRGQAGDC